MSVGELLDESLFDLSEVEQVEAFSEISNDSPVEVVLQYGAWLSVKYATDGHLASPNTTILRQAKRDHPSLPSESTIGRAIDGIPRLAESLGFVTREQATAWSDEDYIENGKWIADNLGKPGEPVMPRKRDLEFAARHKVGPPFEYTEARFGSVAAYQEALGFVTAATVDTWTEDDWIDYGTWLSHMLGTPEQPKMPAFADFAQASALNIGPTPRSINDRYGVLAKYQNTLGFRDAPFEYQHWDRADYIENGVWLSHMLGTPEQPKMPTSRDIETGADLGICPPVSAIEKRFKRSISAYQDALGFVTAATLKRWNDEDWIDNGVWLSHLLQKRVEGVTMPTRGQLGEAAEYGLVPKETQIVDKFGGVMEYQKALGFNDAQHFRTWTKRDYLRYGRQIVTDNNGARPSAKDINAADGPSSKAIQTRFGTIAEFNDRLGFPDYSHLTPEELISFGVRWAHEHDGKIIGRGELENLSKSKTGPSRAYTVSHFGTLEAYRQAVSENYEAFLEVRASHLQYPTAPAQMIDFLMRDFQATPEYLQELDARVEDVNYMRSKYGIKFSKLLELFGKARRTALWNDDDFIYFRDQISKMPDTVTESVEVLHSLDRLGLSPHLDEIEEVFGSVDNFFTAEGNS